MFGFFRGSPLLSLLIGLYGFIGPMLVAFRRELVTQRDSLFNSAWVQPLIPCNFIILAITLLLLYTVKHIEHVIGSLRVLFVIGASAVADAAGRYTLANLAGVRIAASGPYAMVAALFGLYAVFLPTARSSWLGVNEKRMTMTMIIAVGIIDDFGAWISVGIGFAVFLLAAPLCFPRSGGEKAVAVEPGQLGAG
jgi:hypothetical protein